MHKLRYKKQILLAVVILGLLAFVYWWGGDSAGLHGWRTADELSHTAEDAELAKWVTAKEKEKAAAEMGKVTPDEEAPTDAAEQEAQAAAQSDGDGTPNREKAAAAEENGAEVGATDSDTRSADAAPKGDIGSDGEHKTDDSAAEMTCTLSVRCDTVLQNLSSLNPEKAELIPKDGVIFPERTVVFYEGESVFQVLRRELRRDRIPMEFVNTPIYHSAYVEGIANLYEFDCGELSGWVYRVNGQFPNYGSARYQLKPGDRVEWLYTCDRGADVGSSLQEGGQRDA